MIGLIYSLNFVITLPLILIMLYSVGKMELKTKQRNIYIIIFVGIIIFNAFIIHNHREVKSIHNYSTYLAYENISHIFKDVDRYEIDNVSDIEDFKFIIEGLRNQSALLVTQLVHSTLVEEGNDMLKDNLYSLSEELHKFIIHHNKLYADGTDILDDNLSLYNELKSNISDFGNKIRKEGGNAGGNIIGVVEYRIKLEERDLNELSLILDSISEINANIMK